jgi:hypothetical protein
MNINAVMHSAQTVCNASYIQATGGDFHVYQEGTGPVVAQVIEVVDSERLAVAERLDAPAHAELICQGLVAVEAHVQGRRPGTILLAARVRRQPPDQFR